MCIYSSKEIAAVKHDAPPTAREGGVREGGV